MLYVGCACWMLCCLGGIAAWDLLDLVHMTIGEPKEWKGVGII